MHKIEVLALCYTFEFKFCPEYNIKTTSDINLQPFLNKPFFGEHPSVLQILLFFQKIRKDPYTPLNWNIKNNYQSKDSWKLLWQIKKQGINVFFITIV